MLPRPPLPRRKTRKAALSASEYFAAQYPIIALLTDTFSSSVFLAATILLTVHVGLALISGSIPILTLLAIIAMWMGRSAAIKRNASGFLKPLKLLSGVAKAQFIIMWVLVGLIGLIGVVSIVGVNIFSNLNVQLSGRLSSIPSIPAGVSLLVIGVAFIIAAVLVALINIFCYRTFSKTAHSLVTSYTSGRIEIVSLRATKAWLLVIAILTAPGALSSLPGSVGAFFANGVLCAAYILLFIIAKKTDDSLVAPPINY